MKKDKADILTYDSVDRFPESHYTVDVGWRFVEDWLKQHNSFEGSSLDLNPDFQRAHVWTKEQQRGYVEFILRGGESGRTLYWNHPNWMSSFKGCLTLVDGKQRLETVRSFLRDEICIFGDHVISTIEPRFISIVHASFNIRIAKLKTRKEVLEWYLMINAGGTPHSKKELNHVRALLDAEIKNAGK